MSTAGDDVAALEEEAAAAESLAVSLEKRYVAGEEGIDPAAIEEQQKLGRWARLKAQRAATAAAAAKETARRKALKDLRTEIDGRELKVFDQLADLFQAALDAQAAIADAVAEHNAKAAEWTRQALQLGATEVDEFTGAGLEENSGIFATSPSSGVRAGNVTVAHLDGAALVQRFREMHHPEDMVAWARGGFGNVIKPNPNIKYFYRGEGGSVFGYEQPLPPAEIKRLHLTAIRRSN